MAHQPPAGGAPSGGYYPPQGGAPGAYPPQGGAPGYGAPAPGYGAPAGGAPGYGAPAHGAPAGYPPQGGAPGYGAPAGSFHAPPATSGYGGAPGYGAPAGGAPGYGAPAPGYGAPAGGAPAYGAPAHGAPPPWQQNLAQQAQQQEIADLQRYFNSMDRDKSGSITANELMGVSFGGQKFSLDTARRLVKIFDRDQSGNIGFNEYVALHKFIQSMQAAFRAFDADRSGRLEPREVEQALTQGGFRFQQWVVINLMKKFDKTNKGSLDFEQYIQLCALLGALRSTFEMLDTQRSGMVSLNLEQLVNIAANVS